MSPRRVSRLRRRRRGRDSFPSARVLGFLSSISTLETPRFTQTRLRPQRRGFAEAVAVGRRETVVRRHRRKRLRRGLCMRFPEVQRDEAAHIERTRWERGNVDARDVRKPPTCSRSGRRAPAAPLRTVANVHGKATHDVRVTRGCASTRRRASCLAPPSITMRNNYLNVNGGFTRE